jgi:hypothetical protein
VSSSGSSYVCILASQGNAVSNGTYWNIMSSAGTNGTDVGTTLTTQGDILIRNGSGLARLGYGTSGQALITKGSGQNPVWEAVGGGGKVLQVVASSSETNVNTTSTSFTHLANLPSFNFTPSATSSKVLLIANFGAGEIAADNGYLTIFRGSNNLGNATAGFSQIQHSSSHRFPLGGAVYLDSPNTTSQVNYAINVRVSANNMNFGEGCSVNLIAMEIGA